MTTKLVSIRVKPDTRQRLNDVIGIGNKLVTYDDVIRSLLDKEKEKEV